MTAHGAIERPIVNDNSAAARVLPELVQHQFHFLHCPSDLAYTHSHTLTYSKQQIQLSMSRYITRRCTVRITYDR